MASTKTVSLASVHDVIRFIDAQPGLVGIARYAWIIALGGLFLDAFANAALGSALAPLTQQLSLSPTQVGMLSSAAALVALITNPLGGWLADRIGRIKPLLATKIIYIIGAILTSTASDFEMVLWGRILVGVAYGVDFGVALSLMSEYTPVKHKSKINLWAGIWYIAVISNLLITLLFSHIGVGQDVWRYSVASSGVLAFLILLGQLRFLAESPTWHARLGRYSEAARCLKKLFPGHDFVVGKSTKEETKPTSSKGSGFGCLFQGIYLRRTVLSGAISICQYFEYAAVGWYLPVIALLLFEGNFMHATIAAIVYNFFGVVGGFLAPYLGGRFGMRNQAKYGFFAVFLCLVGMALFDGKIDPVLLSIFPALLIFCHSAGPSSVGKSMAALSYRSEVRATGTGFAGLMSNAGAALGLFVFPVLKDAFPLNEVLLILSVVPIIGMIFCIMINWDPTKKGFSPDEETDAPGLLLIPSKALT